MKGKIIASPFSLIATTNSLLWNGCTPVFAEIKPDTYGLDQKSIKEIIRSDNNIVGILGTHLFGNACDVESIEQIAKTQHSGSV